MQRTVLLLLAGLVWASAQPFQPGQNLAPLGNLRTQDFGGPYNLSLLTVQEAEVKSGIAARGNHTDADIVDFLTNVECLEGLFDTWGAFGFGFVGNLELGGPSPIGARKANLSPEVTPYMQEIALSEQGHALFVRQAGGVLPCPQVDFVGGFNGFLAAAYNLGERSIEEAFGSPFDPFLNDQNFILSVLTLEEFGATGNKGLVGITSNPVLANGIAGLATTATAFAAVERTLLWQRRNATVEPFGETVQQVFARISALRDSLDGPQSDDQGLVNSDPRTIAVPDSFINLFPTDVRGLSFSRTPQQLINMYSLGNPDGISPFFPKGLVGAITKPTGYTNMASGLEDFPSDPYLADQESVAEVGKVSPPIEGTSPSSVPGETELTQALYGQLDNGTYKTRGYNTSVPNLNMPNKNNDTQVQVGTPGGALPSSDDSNSGDSSDSGNSASASAQASASSSSASGSSSSSSASSSPGSSSSSSSSSPSSGLPCPCSLPAGYDVNQSDLAGAIKAAGNCPADPSAGCPTGNFGFGNSGGCGNVGCNNTGTGNIGNNNNGTGNKGDNNNGSNNVGRCLDGTSMTGDKC
ncbi:hypothetical protein ABBQ32_14189 [Trebouxia sp. C0010 RCD-2024]